MGIPDQPTNEEPTVPKSWMREFDGWKETATALAPLLLLTLIFMAAWSSTTTLEFFKAHLEALQAHGNYDEVSPFYLGNFLLLVGIVPIYVCVLQYLTHPEFYNRNERKFVLVVVLLSAAMFLTLLINTVGIAVEFGWPFSMRQKWIGLLLFVTAAMFAAGVIFAIVSISRGKGGLLQSSGIQWLAATDTRRISTALIVALSAFAALLTSEMMLPEVAYSPDSFAMLSFAGTPLSQLTASILIWLILFYALSALRLPGITVFFCLCLLWAFFDRADNHSFRQTQSEARMAPGLAGSLQSWLKARPDLKAFADSYYPVYVVAAEGGGMYAAYHAGIVLGRIQDANNSFAQHVLAISSVSGGSLGAAIFSGIVKDGGKGGDVEARIDKFLSQDLLTNVVVRATTSDLAQRAIPIGFDSLDRARGLEYATEKAWQRSFPSETANPFAADFSALWRFDGMAPALLLNTTEVETGDRVVISPFSLKSTADKSGVLNLRALQDEVPGIDLPLSTAVILSARFPYLTPAGSYQRGGRKHRLVDGGYFDNTGIETAMDLIRMLDSPAQISARGLGLKGVRFILLAISTAGSEEQPVYSFGELMSPVRTMVATWHSRGPISVRNADRELNNAGPGTARFRRIVMTPGEKALPLTWYLSAATRTRIRDDLAATTICSQADGAASLSPTQLTRTASSCVVASVIAELTEETTGSPRQNPRQ